MAVTVEMKILFSLPDALSSKSLTVSAPSSFPISAMRADVSRTYLSNDLTLTSLSLLRALLTTHREAGHSRNLEAFLWLQSPFRVAIFPGRDRYLRRLSAALFPMAGKDDPKRAGVRIVLYRLLFAYCFPYMAVMIHHVVFLGCTNKKRPSRLCRKGRFFTYLRMPPIQFLDDLLGRNRDHCSRSEDGGSSMLIEEIVVLSGDDAADYHHDVFPIQSFELLHQLRQ